MTAPASKRRVRTPAPPELAVAAEPTEPPAVMTPLQAFGVLAQAAAAFVGNQQQHMTILQATQVLNTHLAPNGATRREGTP